MSYAAAAATFLCTFLLCNFFLRSCSARDYVTTLAPLIGETNETLVSAKNKFVLGFFTPAANRWYIGIWYSIDPEAVVWVANRDKPLLNRSHGIFTIDEEDSWNLKLLDVSDPDEESYLYFSTNYLPISRQFSRTTAKLLDTGNLVLIDDRNGEKLWQSFNNPTDTFLPGMKMDQNLKLTSWKNRYDPAKGDFTFQQHQDDNGFRILSALKSKPHWKSIGKESIFNLNKMNPYVDQLLSNFSSQAFSVPPAPSPTNLTLARVNFNSTRLIMNFTGEIQYSKWDYETKKWLIQWSQPKGPCSVYMACGVFGSCHSSSTENDRPACRCFPRLFEPSSPGKWYSNDYSDGCSRISDPCKEKGGKDTFFNVAVINVENLMPACSKDGLSEQQCREDCLSKCHCQAYYYSPPTTRTGNNPEDSGANNTSCSCWTSEMDLFNIQEGYAPDTYNLSIRVVAAPQNGAENPGQFGGSQSGRNKSSSHPNAVIIFITVIVAIALFCSISYIAYIRMKAKRKETESIQENPVFQLYDSQIGVKDFIDRGDQFREDDKKDIDVPFFEWESILAATGNFSHANKLGQGGFGPVYKGEFPGGKEIAVKRLSINSVQGLKEFKNEVVLIAKLQHRNLVRLLGYCIMGTEKILLYEYMPNKSLDAFIFDEKLSMLLDWTKRFDIIMGVARGLLYLHQDSRLRIIHRDMKASNILLDEEMNPKISDFGLARIVGGRETEANTNRVVGTYGYMSPEYVLEGQFSIKSDVFSFGVVVLEIISGKKNAGFYQSQLAMNLLGYAWNLWKEEKPLALLDQTLVESCNESEVLKCIMVGLLCVQEDPGDRPNMSKVLFMLNSEMETLPNPKQPAFISRKRFSGTTSSSSSIKQETLSKNEITFSLEDGR